MKKTLVLFLALFLCLTAVFAATPWAEVESPKVISVTPSESDGKEITLTFLMPTGKDGGDKGSVTVTDLRSGEVVVERQIGRSKKAERDISFTLTHSSDYGIDLSLSRKAESDVKRSEGYVYSYSLPLEVQAPVVKNASSGCLRVSFSPVKEAERYILALTDGEGRIDVSVTDKCEDIYFTSLEDGKKYSVMLYAARGEELASADTIEKTVKDVVERDWAFSWFGQSSKSQTNTFKMIDSDAMVFSMTSCTHDANGSILEKGGKFTAFHDGISYYYTEYDPRKENWSLSATFTIDYINPTADGQEGFGIVAMDTIGENGNSAVNHYTNSAGIIATKFEDTIGGVKKTCKDTLGARFVTGITPEVISGGDEMISKEGTSESHAFSYDQSDLVRAGDVYRITLIKDNTGYRAIYKREMQKEDTVEEYILYGPEKLEMLDPERSYVGFAVARGCDVTVSDVVFTVTDPANDPPGEKEPKKLLPLSAKVDSPSGYYSSEYPFDFIANSDGVLTVKKGKETLIDKARVAANEDFEAELKIGKGFTDFTVMFDPDDGYMPYENTAIAQYDSEEKAYKENYNPIYITHSVSFISYDGDKIVVSPDGTIWGDGSEKDPVDLMSALSYARPGQDIVLKSGTYSLTSLTIERGNSGNEKARKILTCQDGRAVFDFRYAKSGMQVWGDWWQIENIDVCNTPGNIKGLQIAGDHNIVKNVHAYHCGDTGIQISGVSTEPFEKWPHDNFVVSCVSYGNSDPAENNADGFAAKLTAGEGNVFKHCVAYCNIDDGWDLFSKVESGPIGEVVIDSCVAFKNGMHEDGTGNGDGNGFKMGGDGILVRHTLKNSASFLNGKSGVTSNSNPGLSVEDSTFFANGEVNVTLYGKGKGERDFKASGILSFDGVSSDNIREMPELKSDDNFFWNGAKAENASGQTLDKAIFTSAEFSGFSFRDDGSIDLKGFLETSVEQGAKL